MLGVATRVSAIRIAILILASLAFLEGAIKGGYSIAEETGALGGKLENRNAYEVIIKRNLFDHTRSPGPDMETQPIAVSSQKVGMNRIANINGMVLKGVVIFNDRRVAVIKETARSRENLKEVKTGDSLGAYKVIRIEDEALILKGPDESLHLLTLFNMETPKERKHIKARGPVGYGMRTQ